MLEIGEFLITTCGYVADRMSSAEVVESLRGKVLEKEEKEDGQQWTPYNANMSMQGIKVRGGISKKVFGLGIAWIVLTPLSNVCFFGRQKQCIKFKSKNQVNS